MTVKTINDWRYLFSKDSIGGRLSAFTFLNLNYMHTGEKMIDGFTIIILGLGISIKPTEQ